MGTKQPRTNSGAASVDVPSSQNSARALLTGGLAAPYDFLLPTPKIQISTIDTAKYFLDPLTLSHDPTKRHDSRKRKRSAVDGDEALQLGQLYVEGFTSDQIWEQAVRILDSAGKGIQRDYDLNARYSRNLPSKTKTASDDFDGSYDDSEHSDEDGFPGSVKGSSDESDISDGGGEISAAGEEDSISDSGSIDGGTGETAHASDTRKTKPDAYTKDRFGLNDGFFSIDDFNKQSEFFENSDAKGAPNERESDDDEVDWDADPLAGGAKDSSDAGTDDDSEEEGPTFDDAYTQGKLDQNDDAALDEEEEEGSADEMDTGLEYPEEDDMEDDISPPGPAEPISENDVHRAAANVRRDLFDDEISDDEDAPADQRADRSAHEKQRARIADEIRRLEAANVSKKEWMVAGEARAAERPMNSLIEEDLEFERIGKPVPVVTNEVSEGIEDLVKRRILAKEFDEVIRRHPGVSDGQEVKRGRFELDDTKPKQSLTELYEADHLRATAPNYVDPKNQKLMRVHAELTSIWKDISSQLDTLSNSHYKPNAPQADINVVPDVATVTMEDARPTAGGSLGGSAALAPQEIYAPGDGKEAGELVPKSGAPISKDEMTREAKGKMRRQQKKQKKAHGGHPKRQPREAGDKQQVVSDLKKGGVKVIGKEGEITDVQGNKPQKQGHGGGDMLKL